MNETLSPTPVAVERVDTYDRAALLAAMRRGAQAVGLPADYFRGKRVVIKPNLIAPFKPDAAATTHPAVLAAAADLLRAYGADNIMLAESPGGLYTESALRAIYKNCGITAAAEEIGLPLNVNTDAVTIPYSEGAVCHSFHVIKPIAEADVIIDLCKLKSHSLTRLSCAAKNLFGIIPGVEKFEMHSAYPTLSAFSDMIVDLNLMLRARCEVIAICDGIVAMEGNGPTGGTPRALNALLMSRDPFALDAAAEQLIGFAGTVSICEAARRRGLVPEIEACGTPLTELAVTDFREPDASAGTFLRRLPDMFGGRLAKFLSPRPQIDAKKCIGCGKCAESCPRHVIDTVPHGKGRIAKIRPTECIRCFCCQELCPIHAVKIHKNFIFKLIR